VGAAGRTSGKQSAEGSFALASGNTNPKDIVTDGSHLWVVDDAEVCKVFKYTLSGTLVASWSIDSRYMFNTDPTGITLDPANPSHLWIVDSGTDRVYEFTNAVSQPNGTTLAASVSYALAFENQSPQGIADPPLPASAGPTPSASVSIPMVAPTGATASSSRGAPAFRGLQKTAANQEGSSLAGKSRRKPIAVSPTEARKAIDRGSRQSVTVPAAVDRFLTKVMASTRLRAEQPLAKSNRMVRDEVFANWPADESIHTFE
jgi:hypothetical protein